MGQAGTLLLLLSCLVTVTVCLGAATSTDNGAGDARLKAPWTAAIFRKVADTKDKWEFICSGTITGRYTVITSARCLIPRVSGPKFSSRPHHLRYSDLQVVAGLPTNDLVSKDQFTQIGIVGQIRDIYDSNNGDTPERDIAALRLTNVLNFTTPYVKEVLLLEKSGTLLEAKETKPGETLMISGYEKARGGVQTRTQSKTGSPLKVSEVKIEEIGKCIERYTEAYPTFYFNALCGAPVEKTDIIPCNYEGSGLVKKVKDATGSESYYLFGVYSSNTALAKSEGTLVSKNDIVPGPCTASDLIFFSKYSQEGRWATSNNFCDNALAMCENGKCRPWSDLCNGQQDCEDGSDEKEKTCFNQNVCGKEQFKCGYGACIEKKLTCDGVRDCKDGSDEDKNGACKGRSAPASAAGATCEGIKSQEAVTAHCSHPDRKGLIPCNESVPIGTSAVLRRTEIIVKCERAGKWSRSTRLTC
ncbi:unnamed protein product [Orchesella dallaii]|uniref:Peptidase S1 domain-containing protein n=1 Tax=Orchesella dallaii TaxID=48710 RepID=A0ABP1Q6R2_9HEXA